MSSYSINKKFRKLANHNWSLRKGLVHASWTVVRHAKHKVPVDTGRLRASIGYEIDGYDASIGTNVEYAEWNEFNNKAYLRPAIQLETEDILHQISKDLKADLKRLFR